MNNSFISPPDLSTTENKVNFASNKTSNKSALNDDDNGFSQSLREAEDEYQTKEASTQKSNEPQSSQTEPNTNEPTQTNDPTQTNEPTKVISEQPIAPFLKDTSEFLPEAPVPQLEPNMYISSEVIEIEIPDKLDELQSLLMTQFPEAKNVIESIKQSLEQAYQQDGMSSFLEALVPENLDVLINAQLRETSNVQAIPEIVAAIRTIFPSNLKNHLTLESNSVNKTLLVDGKTTGGYNQNFQPTVMGVNLSQDNGQAQQDVVIDPSPLESKPLLDAKFIVKTAENPQLNELILKFDPQTSPKSIVETETYQQITTGPVNNNALALNPTGSAKAQIQVSVPFQQNQWGQAVAERVLWMSNQNIKEAEVHLDPPELGPIQVKVSISNEQAHVSFVVQHSNVREALDQSAMRLREMFEGEGLDLVDVDVSEHSQQDTKDDGASSEHDEGMASNTTNPSEQDDSKLKISVNQYHLVNTYV